MQQIILKDKSSKAATLKTMRVDRSENRIQAAAVTQDSVHANGDEEATPTDTSSARRSKLADQVLAGPYTLGNDIQGDTPDDIVD